MQDEQIVRDYEFEQLQLENLQRIHRYNQRILWFERNKLKLFYFLTLAAFCIGYALGSFTK